MVKINDRLVVQGMSVPAYVEKIEFEPSTGRTVLSLDWKEHGKSKVYLHDENHTWYLYSNNN